MAYPEIEGHYYLFVNSLVLHSIGDLAECTNPDQGIRSQGHDKHDHRYLTIYKVFVIPNQLLLRLLPLEQWLHPTHLTGYGLHCLFIQLAVYSLFRNNIIPSGSYNYGKAHMQFLLKATCWYHVVELIITQPVELYWYMVHSSWNGYI